MSNKDLVCGDCDIQNSGYCHLLTRPDIPVKVDISDPICKAFVPKNKEVKKSKKKK